jgi:hypothetical protein
LIPAIRRATTIAPRRVTSLTRKPTVPAVPGSSRRYRAGLDARHSALARLQPRTTSRITVAIRTSVP